jgi:hypothetical protein
VNSIHKGRLGRQKKQSCDRYRCPSLQIRRFGPIKLCKIGSNDLKVVLEPSMALQTGVIQLLDALFFPIWFATQPIRKVQQHRCVPKSHSASLDAPVCSRPGAITRTSLELSDSGTPTCIEVCSRLPEPISWRNLLSRTIDTITEVARMTERCGRRSTLEVAW